LARADSNDEKLRERARDMVAAGVSKREVARLLSCNVRTVMRMVGHKRKAELAEVQADRKARVLAMHAQGENKSAIAEAVGLSRRGVRLIIEAEETGVYRREPPPQPTQKERNNTVVAALETLPAHNRDVANDREAGANAKDTRFQLRRPIDNGPQRQTPPADNDNAARTGRQKVIDAREKDGLSEKQIAHLFGVSQALVAQVLAEHALRREQDVTGRWVDRDEPLAEAA
jgi:transposase